MIRKAIKKDVAEVSKIHVLSWQHAYKGIINQSFLDGLDVEKRKVSWNKILEQSLGDLFVAVDNQQIIGFVHICRCRDSDQNSEKVGEITSIYLDPKHVGRGVGFQLFTQAIKTLKASGFEKVMLWVLQENYSARAFYDKMGFEADGTEKYLENLLLTEIRYQRALSE
ncbi:GNAT family N-acetyltransferase [Pelagibaculum spongiae]|uniref:N-acetyltransferase domain-containing protein n=1 Tax=Pelagibaculum spongiae TaxID=2080658 RepID=A0A2V1GNG4_9GAMM|nr:GNAT family N-acetyltransferase [Pelagibaculum spongiae]PVZ63471.1 hypothetical protein DC094_21435 [Pelagibaculum spongiae]